MPRVPYVHPHSSFAEEAFALLEKRPRSITDINALAQTMGLKKYNRLTNRVINNMRTQIHRKIHESRKQPPKPPSNPSDAKYNYVNRLLLYDPTASTLVKAVQTEQIEENESEYHELICNPRWPICMFDHTYKNRGATYFCFVPTKPPTFIWEYFDHPPSTSTSTSSPYASPSLVALAAKAEPGPEDSKGKVPSPRMMPIQQLNLIAEENKDRPRGNKNGVGAKQGKIASEDLLAERNPHYCQKSAFTSTLNWLLKQDIPELDVFSHELAIGKAMEGAFLLDLMDNYIKHILTYHDKIVTGKPEYHNKQPAKPTRDPIRCKTMTAQTAPAFMSSQEFERHRMERASVQFEYWEQLRDANHPLGRYMCKVSRKMPYVGTREFLENSSTGQFLKNFLGNTPTI